MSAAVLVARALPPCSVWAFAAANAGTASGRQMVAASPAAVGAAPHSVGQRTEGGAA